MGSIQSVQVNEEEDEDDEDHHQLNDNRELNNPLMKKILEQEPEMLPCHASASPLSPQLSSLGTPRLGPSIKVWDPYNVLSPPPPLPPPPPFSANFPPTDSIDEDRAFIQVFLICHGESQISLRPELVAGRCPEALLTANGQRQARALAVFLNSQGVRFSSVYSSPSERARTTAVYVCQEMNFEEERIQSSEALSEMSQGHWEGCHRSEIYTSEMWNLIERIQPDFAAPSGESLRQVEFRMVQFLNGTILGLPEKLRSEFSSPHQNDNQVFSHQNPHPIANSMHERDGPSFQPPPWNALHRQRPGLLRKKSGKSRLQFVTSGDHEVEEEFSPHESNHQTSPHEINIRSSSSTISSIGVFTHSLPIKCLLTGILGCSPTMSQKLCIEDSSVTVLRHSWKTGWQIKKLNDTAHLRLL
ncbi:Histidine phosphatase superfamily, clade-1 [Dillenia turbinata]|uniref:Histidine phosphatase superfamily, clade-1 n=1 Tax=Dillenia turbinata TaxID=194707 RepID=A0AAN8VJM3_9MAGN